MRLIDADELKKHKYHDKKACENAVAVYYIDNAPSIDIVHCRECRHWHDHITSSWCSRGAEMRPQESGWIKRKADDFCSYGCRSEKPNNSKERSRE